MMYRFFRVVLYAFLTIYVIALAILAIGTFGLFGQEQDPLAGILLVLIGSPWTQIIVNALPALASPVVGMVTPLINAAFIAGVGRLFARS